MDINRTTLADLYVGFLASFQVGLRSREDATAWQRIATLVPSSTSKNVYPWLGQWPKMREWLGDRIIKKLSAHRFEVENKKFETTVSVDREAIEDDAFGVYNPMFIEMGTATAEWPDEVVFGLLKQGKTALGYDNVPFFSANHPHKIKGTVSNYDSGAAPAWYLFDTSRALKPLIWQLRVPPRLTRLDREEDENVFFRDEYVYGVRARGNAGFGLWQLAYRSELELNEDNFAAAVAAMKSLTNDEGSSLGIVPRLLVVPPELEVPARKIANATTNAMGETNVLQGMVEVYVTNLVAE